MDPSAYMERKDWLKMLCELGLDEVSLRDHRYDCVFHLVTAAKGAESFYQVENNATRTEGIELARTVDTQVMNAWMGHSSLQVIDNIDVSNFTEKLDRLVQGVSTRLGLIHDTERYGKRVKKHKFLVRNYLHSTQKSDFPLPCRDFHVEHCYLKSNDQTQTRIRKRNEIGSTSHHFTMTTRRDIDGQRVEIRRNVSPREYESYRSQTDPDRAAVEKIRRCFLYNERYFQLDVYQSPQKGLVLLEGYIDYEKKGSSSDISHFIPDFLDCLDVTDNPEYSMYTISAF